MKRFFIVSLLFLALAIFGGVAAAEIITLRDYDENGNCVREMYIEEEQPFFYNDSYYGVLRAFEGDQCISITYLDANGNPMLNKSGYASVDRTFDDENHVVEERYYGVDGKPISLWGKHYGLRRWTFDERGNCTEYSYLDINGNPMVITSGYATVKRTFNADNKVDTNMYFGVDDQPIKLSLGQYGDKHRYQDGRDTWITYLGIDGEPIKTNSGYTSIKREYGENGKISIEWYYGLNGEQIELRRGQYGTRFVYEGSKITERVPLDRTGNPIFLLDQCLSQHPWLVVMGALCVISICILLPRRLRWGLLALYFFFILYMTLFVREAQEDAPLSFELFRSVKVALDDNEGYSSWAQIVHNILLFVPFGFIICALYTPHSWNGRIIAIIASVLFSVLIEGTQYFTGLGWAELDDIIWNELGGCIGTYAATLIWKTR